MRALVLGVNGLSGRAIAADLAEAGWSVVGTGRERARFPSPLRRSGVRFEQSDRNDAADLAAALSTDFDVVVDCLAYTADHARQLLRHRDRFGSAVVLSSKAVYVDAAGRHSNSPGGPRFERPVDESQTTMAPDFSGDYRSANGYGSNKVAMELTCLESGLPVSILRPSRIHGVGAARPREWFVVRRVIDGRRRIPAAHRGLTGNHPTAAVNLARLVRSCAMSPAPRILNAADPGAPTATDVITAIGAACGQQVDVIGLPDDVDERFGWTPWDTWPPFFLDTTAASLLGYRPVGDYAETVVDAVRDLFEHSAQRRSMLTHDPYFVDRFDYRLDDAAFRAAERSPGPSPAG